MFPILPLDAAERCIHWERQSWASYFFAFGAGRVGEFE